MVRLNSARSGFSAGEYYYIDVVVNPFRDRMVVTTRYEATDRGGSQVILEREQALELAKNLLEAALTIEVQPR